MIDFKSIFVALSLLANQTNIEGFYPWSAVDITSHVNGGNIYANINDYCPHSTEYGMPNSWIVQDYGLQGNDKMFWMVYLTPTTGWYEIRIDNTMMMANGWGGAQTLLFPGNLTIPQILDNNEFQGYFVTGATQVPHTGMSESLYIYLQANLPLYIAVDGWGPSVGKFEVRVRRSRDANGDLVSHPWWDGPATYQKIID